jgi:hypothetical protein
MKSLLKFNVYLGILRELSLVIFVSEDNPINGYKCLSRMEWCILLGFGAM